MKPEDVIRLDGAKDEVVVGDVRIPLARIRELARTAKPAKPSRATNKGTPRAARDKAEEE